MNILDRLWEAYRDIPFASFSLQRKLDLSHEELGILLNTIADLADNGTARAGYRAKRTSTTTYKLTKATPTQSTKNGGDSLSSLPLTEPKESLTEANTAVFDDQSPENEPLEQFSFFARADQSKESKHTGNIQQLHQKLTTDSGWKLKIEHLRSLTGDAQAKAKAKLPAFTPSVCLSSGKRTGDFVHTNLIQADFDEATDFDKLFDELCSDPHARLVFRSPRGKVKALIKVSSVATTDEHAAAFEAVKSYCQAQGYGEIDSQPKNINCLCFISHHPGAVLKNASALNWEPRSVPTAQPTNNTVFDGEVVALTEWLKAHDVIIHETRDHNGNPMYLVDCPWESEHTQDFGHKDTAVFVDPTDNKWCFNCFHAHCEHRNWKDYRAKVAPKAYRHDYHTHQLMNRRPR